MMRAAITWDPNDGLYGESTRIGDWRGRLMSLGPAQQSVRSATKPLLDSCAPTVSKKKVQYKASPYEITGAFCSLCPHEEALRRSFFTFTESTMKNFIVQSITSLLQSQTTSNVALKCSEVLLIFSKSSTELFSKFCTACIQVVNTKKQHFRNLYFRLLGFGTIFAP